MTSVNTIMLLLEYKSIDVEARSHRKNLLFNGYPEEYAEDCLSKVKKLLIKCKWRAKIILYDDIFSDKILNKL